MNVKLTYFKRTGKYYAEAAYESLNQFPFEVYREVREMLDTETLPGLIEGHSEFVVLVQPEDDGVPALIGVKESTQ